jgi:hypothetical protein
MKCSRPGLATTALLSTTAVAAASHSFLVSMYPGQEQVSIGNGGGFGGWESLADFIGKRILGVPPVSWTV